MKKAIIFVDIISALFSFIFLFMAILSYSNTTYDPKFTEPYRNNWDQSPVTSIFVTTSIKCPSGFEPLISSTYPGNFEGCDCTHSSNKDYDQSIYKSSCKESQILNGCRIIEAHGPTQMFQWQKKTICAKRDNINHYFEIIHHAYEATCPSNKKKCGILDTTNNIYCVPNEEECPINYLEIIPTTEQPMYERTTAIPLNDKYTLYYSNEITNGPILISVITSPGKKEVCSHPYEGLLGENDYILNTRRGNSTCKTKIGHYLYDWRYSLVDSDTLNTFYKMNGIDKLISYLPLYPPLVNTNEEVMLSSLNYFGIHPKCFNKLPSIKFLNLDIKGLESRAFGLTIFCIIHIIFIISAIFVYKIIKKYIMPKTIIITIDVIHFLLLLTIFIVALAFSIMIIKQLKDLSHFIHHTCGDELTDNVLKLSLKPLHRSKQYYIALYSIGGIEIGMKIGFYVWFYAFEKMKIN